MNLNFPEKKKSCSINVSSLLPCDTAQVKGDKNPYVFTVERVKFPKYLIILSFALEIVTDKN